MFRCFCTKQLSHCVLQRFVGVDSLMLQTRGAEFFVTTCWMTEQDYSSFFLVSLDLQLNVLRSLEKLQKIGRHASRDGSKYSCS